MTSHTRTVRLLVPPLAFLAVAVLLLAPATLGGRVLVPADLLRGLSPWSAAHAPDTLPLWDPLLYDSVGQFHPWRQFAAENLRAGRVPLWNPYQFCGTPFVANSQSAVFYPPNLLYAVLSPDRAVGWSAALHLALAGWFMWLLMARLGVGAAGCALAGAVYALSCWQMSWLHLPTFLATSCWIPLAAWCVVGVAQSPRLRGVAALGATMGMMLLAGHLQIAFFGVLAIVLLGAWLAAGRWRLGDRSAAAGSLLAVGASLALGGLLAAPQLLPTVELAGQSHRAGRPTADGLAAYASYAVHPEALATLLLPEAFGGPARPEAPYFGRSSGGMLFHPAEGAMYVGLGTLLLAGYAVVRRRRSGRLLGYFATTGLLAFAVALATPIVALLYFGVPGFAASGSPGRALVLWAFAAAALAAIGYDRLAREEATPVRGAAGVAGAVSVAVAVAGGLAFLVAATRAQAVFGDGTAWDAGAFRQAALLALSAGAFLAMAAGWLRGSWMACLLVVVVAVDLIAAGVPAVRTAEPRELFPETPLIKRARELAGHDRVAPINRGWSFGGPTAVLPPNAAMVYGLRDVQGYDSLFPGQYKRFLADALGADPSPPEVGNMVFVRAADAALLASMGVRHILSLQPLGMAGAREEPLDGAWLTEIPGAPGRAHTEPPGGRVEWLEDGPNRVALRVRMPVAGWLRLADQRMPGWHATVDGRLADIEPDSGVFRRVRLPAGDHEVVFAYQPASYRTGVYGLLVAVAALTAALSTGSVGPRRSRGGA